MVLLYETQRRAKFSQVSFGHMLITVLLILNSASAAQAVERDIPYGPDAQQRLDLFLPGARGFPTVIFVHGGSLTSGDKADDDYGAVCQPFAASGIGCANINYRLGPSHKWPAQAEDVASAVAWVRHDIGARGGDSAKLVLMGHSSGATLVALVGSDESYLATQSLTLHDIRGVIPMGSIMWDEDLAQAIQRRGRGAVAQRFTANPDNALFSSLDQYLGHWPIEHIHAGLPSFLFLIAEEEQEQPPILMTNRTFVERSRALGNEADYLVLKDRDHYGVIHRVGEPGDPAFHAIVEFIERSTR